MKGSQRQSLYSGRKNGSVAIFVIPGSRCARARIRGRHFEAVRQCCRERRVRMPGATLHAVRDVERHHSVVARIRTPGQVISPGVGGTRIATTTSVDLRAAYRAPMARRHPDCLTQPRRNRGSTDEASDFGACRKSLEVPDCGVGVAYLVIGRLIQRALVEVTCVVEQRIYRR